MRIQGIGKGRVQNFDKNQRTVYICVKGAENTKVSTSNKCKVQNFDNNLEDSVNQEYQCRNQ